MTIEQSVFSIAGTNHSVNCNVILQIGDLDVIEWLWPNGTSIENNTFEGVSLSSPSPSGLLILNFSPLRTSHEGIYLCMGSLLDSNDSIIFSVNYFYNLTVQSELTYVIAWKTE